MASLCIVPMLLSRLGNSESTSALRVSHSRILAPGAGINFSQNDFREIS